MYKLLQRPRVSGNSSEATRLKILLVIEATDGGTARHCIDLISGLLEQEMEVILCYSRMRASDKFLDEVRKLQELGLKTLVLDISRAPHWTDITAILSLRKFIERNGPFDIVHAQSTKGMVGPIAAMGKGAVKIFTPHALRSLDPSLTRFRRSLFKIIELILVKLSDHIITVSRCEFEHARSLGIPSDKLSIINNGLTIFERPSRESVRRELNLDENTFCIGFVGRLDHQKAPELSISTLELVVTKHQNSKLVIVGSGPLEPVVSECKNKNNLSGCIITNKKIDGRRAMEAFDLFILTSRYEGLPYVLLEAIDSGLPVVTLNVGGVAECVQEGVNGYLIDSWDVEEFADKIVSIASNPKLARTMGDASRKIAKQFTIEKMTIKTLELYFQILNRGQSTSLINSHTGMVSRS